MRSLGKSKARASRGSALIFALVTVTLVAGLSYSLLKITHFVGQRQSTAADDKRAFYLAEAGLAEAYFGLSRGYTGTLGTPDAPVRIGEGLVWVEATDVDDEVISLRSTGLCGSGRSTVEITVERIDLKLGIFADEGIDLEVPFLLDGFDSSEMPYEELVSDGVILVDTSSPSFRTNGVDIFHYEGTHYRYYSVDGNRYAYDAYFDPRANREWIESLGFDPDSLAPEEQYKCAYYYFESIPIEQSSQFLGDYAMDSDLATMNQTGSPNFASGTSTTSSVASSIGPTTGIGGVLSSNGDISLGSPEGTVELFGDVMHGPEGETVLDGVFVTGQSGQLPERVELDAVQPPEVEMLEGFIHDSAIPRVIPPGDIGYESALVQSDSELVILGPGSAVFGDLELAENGRLSVENQDGKVDVFVTGRVGFDEGSQVTVASEQSSDLTLQVVGGPDPVDLYAGSLFRGGVYAPNSHVAIGSNFELFGFLISNTLSLEPGTRLHFDAGLDASLLIPRLIGWKIEEIPAHVRQNRGDPFRLMYGEGGEPATVEDAMETEGWVFEVVHFVDSKMVGKYLGPAHTYEPWESDRYLCNPDKIQPPSVGELSWFVSVTYENSVTAQEVSYDGPFESFPGFSASRFTEFRVWSE